MSAKPYHSTITICEPVQNVDNLNPNPNFSYAAKKLDGSIVSARTVIVRLVSYSTQNIIKSMATFIANEQEKDEGKSKMIYDKELAHTYSVGHVFYAARAI